MELLICVINDEDKLDDILAGLVELGVTGATVVSSQGMGRRLAQTPVLAGLQDLLAGPRAQNTTIFSVIDSDDKLSAAMDMIQRVCGDMEAAGKGIVFTVPVKRVAGLAHELDA
jgi:nitrogen regulatory protein P-II 1